VENGLIGSSRFRRAPTAPALSSRALRRWLVPGLVLAALAPLPLAGAKPAPRPFGVVDLHVDLAYETNYRGHAFAEGTGQFRAADLARAGVLGVVLPLFVPREVAPAGPRASDYESSYARVYGELAKTPPFRLPGCLPRDGGVRTWLSFEGIGALAGTPEALVGWAARGLRVLGPVHTKANELASSSGDPTPASFGLTARGESFLRAAAGLGMLLDVSHASTRATRDMLALGAATGTPVIATHSNAVALAKHPRNLTDDELRAIARSGGVVGVNFHERFVSDHKPATLDDVVRQVRHLVRVMGATHVALGSDFEGDIRPPAELSDVTGYQGLAAALLAAGLDAGDVAKIMGENALGLLCRAAPGTAP
jgi:membrane dipeptidase